MEKQYKENFENITKKYNDIVKYWEGYDKTTWNTHRDKLIKENQKYHEENEKLSKKLINAEIYISVLKSDIEKISKILDDEKNKKNDNDKTKLIEENKKLLKENESILIDNSLLKLEIEKHGIKS